MKTEQEIRAALDRARYAEPKSTIDEIYLMYVKETLQWVLDEQPKKTK